jgi:hypothetical protein
MVMKNLHVLPTDKPSRLSILNSGKLNFGAEIMSSSNSKPQHIYITSDEEIKVGDWCYNSINNNVYKKEIDKLSFAYEYKIILTTDQDLIKDGVQDIDDEFLEWFIKNPSCEEVEVDKNWNYPLDKRWEYKIIIPKEEQKQHLIDIMRGDEELGLYGEPKQIKCYCGHTTYCDCSPQEEPKQETLEETAERLFPKEKHPTSFETLRKAFISSAGRQQRQQEKLEKLKDLSYWRANAEEDYMKVPISVLRYITELENGMYSEEEVIDLLQEMNDWPTIFDGRIDIREWFEQFKKK